MPKLDRSEIHAFLDEPGHLARIGTVDDDGMPRVLPLWFIVIGSELLFTPRSPAIIWRNIQRDPRVGISIDEEAAPWRKVTLQGRVVVKHQPGHDDAWRDIYRRIAKRYVPDEAADGYVDGTDDQPRALCGLALNDPGTRIVSWRMPVTGEDPRGVWAKRYFLPGTKWSDQ
jgi:nitroimidazol reductase NimA-like FMN-containing flavoprotein (pyridoxamine 5'-phosphate oxidase superfamily)